MAKIHGFEVYNASGQEITESEIYKEAADFWGVPYTLDELNPLANVCPFGSDIDTYSGIICPICDCREGLVDYHEVVGNMISQLSGSIRLNTRSYKMLVDSLKPFIKLLRHWQDKGYKFYSTRWDNDEEPSENIIKLLKKVWEEECPPSYAKYGDIQDFNPYLND